MKRCVDTVLDGSYRVTNRRPKIKGGERGCLWGFGGGFKKDRTFNFKLWSIILTT